MYARGSKAYGYCDRTGFRYPLKDLIPEVQNGIRTGLLIGKDVVDPDHPQNFVGRLRVTDPQSLKDPRPETATTQPLDTIQWEVCLLTLQVRWAMLVLA